jgi:hypothetical protein
MAFPLLVIERLDALTALSQIDAIQWGGSYSTLLSQSAGIVFSSKLLGKLIFAGADVVTALAIYRVLLLTDPKMSKERAARFTSVSILYVSSHMRNGIEFNE